MNCLKSTTARIVFALLLALPAVASPLLATPADYFTVTGCRVYDSRSLSPLQGPSAASRREIQVSGVCGIPSDASAAALNITVVDPTKGGFLIAYNADLASPPTPFSTLNFPAGKTLGNNAIVELSATGKIAVELGGPFFTSAADTAHLVIDVAGHFVENQLPVAEDDTAMVNEDDPATTIDVLANDHDDDVPPDPFTIASASDPANGTVVIAGDNLTLTYQPDANYCNDPGGTPDTFTYTLSPGGDTAMVSVTVKCVNDAPAGADKTVTTGQGTDYVFATADFGFTDPDDTPANALLAVKITTLPVLGSLTLSGGAVSAGQFIAATDIAAGNLKFTPTGTGTGTPYASFTFQVQDDGGTAMGGVDLDPSANTITINVDDVNDAPVGADKTVTVLEDNQHTFTTADFGFTDPNDTPPDALAAVKISTLPAAGSLTLSGSPFVAGTEISATDITAGNLKFTPAANASGSPYTSFTFQVRDDGGTTGGGVDLDQTPNTLTIDVTAVNDAPAGADKTITAFEDTDYVFTAADFGFTDPNDTPPNVLAAVKITTLPGAGSLTLSGSPFAAGTEIAVADINAGNLKFKAAANASGSPYTTFTFQVRDNGGTANTGVDLDQTPNTITFNVTAINDAPAGTDKTVTTLEETQYTFTVADFGFTDPNDTPANAFQSVKITTLPGAGSLTLSGSPFAAGTEILVTDVTAGNLKFTPAANGFGTPYASFTFQVRDGGGTANSGVDLDPTPNTMTIDVTAVNDAPAGTDKTITVFEDTQYTFTAADFGFTDPNDTPANNLQSVVITTLPGAGSLTLSGSPFAAGTEIPVASINAGNLKFLAAPNAFGSPYTTFTFQVRDNGGTANTGVDLDPTPNTITINVTPVNDAPAGTNNTVTTPEDIQYTFTAADFGFTDPNDSPANNFQSVVITTLPGAGSLTLSGSGFAAGTEISVANINAGNLKFLGAPNAFGSPYTTFTFQVRDDGGTLNGGINLDPTPNTMTIDVTPVNDLPTAGTDSWTTIGNTELRVNRPAPPSRPFLADPAPVNGVLANDSDPVEGTPITLTGIPGCDTSGPTFGPCPTANGGTVTLEDDGTFSYTPAAGSSAADSFTYTIVDADGGPATGTVNLTISNMVWYVDPDAPGGGNGTSTSPFNSLTATNVAGAGGAGDKDGPGNYIYIDDGTLNTTQTLELEVNQHLIGEGADLSFNLALNLNAAPAKLADAGTKPLLTNTSGDTVKVTTAIPVEIVGLSLAGGTTAGGGSCGSPTFACNAIDLTTAAALTGSGTLTIDNNQFRGAGAEGIDVNLNAGTTGTLALNLTSNTWDIAGTHTGNAVDINRAAGTLKLDFSNNTSLVSNATAVNIAGGSAASTTITGFANNTVHQNTVGSGIVVSSATFDMSAGAPYNQVSGGNTAIGISGDGVGGAGMVMSGVAGDLAFTNLNIFTSGGAGLQVTGTGAVNIIAGTGTQIGVGAGTIDATGGPAVDFTSLTSAVALTTLKSTNSATTGVNLQLVGGSLTAGNTSAISNATGTDFNVFQSNATVTYDGTITDTTGNATNHLVLVDSCVSGTKTFTGAISDTGSGTGGGVWMTNNPGVTVNYTGQLTLATGGTNAFVATGGGTVSSSNTNSTIVSTTGTALNVTSTQIGAAGLKFKSISAGIAASGPSSGIILNSTGATAGLTVIGSGSAGSGGTIQKTTSHGISLTSTLSPSFSWMMIKNSGGSGVKGTGVTNFTFTNGTVDVTGSGADESNIAFNTASAGTENNLSGTVTITNNSLTNSVWHGVDIQNFNGTLSDISISSNTVTSPTSTATSKGSGIRLQALGSTTTAANVTKATISNNIISNFPSGAGILAQGGNSNASGPTGTFGVAGSGSSIISITGNQIAGQSSANEMGTSAIIASVNGKGQANFDISSNGTVANPLANMAGTAILCGGNGNTTSTFTVSNNVIVANNTVASNGVGGGTGVTFGTADTPDMTWTITNNNVSATDGNGILAVARGATGNLKVKIQNNTVAAPLTGVRSGIRIDAGNASSVNDSVCLNISGNTSAGSGGVQGIGLRKQGTVTTTNAFAVNGMAATSSPGVETYVNGLNPAGNGTLLLSATSGFSNCSLP